MILEDLLKWLPKRQSNSHKGEFGHVLIVGGNLGMLGSVILAAQGASHVGAGLVTVATHPNHAPLVSVKQPNVMSVGVQESDDLIPLIHKASVIIIGPGLGQDEWARKFLSTVFSTSLPLIVDADALNLLAQFRTFNHHWILTPHPGEASRLLNLDIKTIQENRSKTVSLIQQQYGGVTLLKGAGTLIKDQDNTPIMCQAGNPGMSTGGMGDVLSGIIGGLVAQHLSLFNAATLGVHLHAYAADQLAKTRGERGMLPQELPMLVRSLMNAT